MVDETKQDNQELNELHKDPSILLVSLHSHSALAPLKDEYDREIEPHGGPIGELNDSLGHLPPNCHVRIVVNTAVDLVEGKTGQRGAEMLAEYSQQLAQNPNIVNIVNSSDVDKDSDRRLGDVFEYTDFAAGQSVRPFLAAIKESKYGGINRTFWYDYIRNKNPPELQSVIVECGGKLAVSKTIDTVEWLIDQIKEFRADTPIKHVVVAIAHEEVLETLTCQVAAYLHQTQTEDLDIINELAEAYFDFKEGLDLHISADNVLIFDVKGIHVAIELSKFAVFLKSQQRY